MSVDMVKKAGVVLEKFSQEAAAKGTEDVFPNAELYLLPDRSGSMGSYYRDERQPITRLAEQLISLGLARLDPDGKVDVAYWHTSVQRWWEATAENLHGYRTRLRTHPPILQQAEQAAGWGGTATHEAIDAALAKHLEKGGATPGLAVIQTDGQPDSESAAINALVRASHYNLFYVFAGYGPGADRFLQKLNRGGFDGQVVDNAYAFNVGPDPATVDDEWLYTQLLTEVPAWRAAARGKVQGTV